MAEKVKEVAGEAKEILTEEKEVTLGAPEVITLALCASFAVVALGALFLVVAII